MGRGVGGGGGGRRGGALIQGRHLLKMHLLINKYVMSYIRYACTEGYIVKLNVDVYLHMSSCALFPVFEKIWSFVVVCWWFVVVF